MRSSPFNVDRYLNVPPNFSVSVLARIPNARFMAVTPNGDVLVSQPGWGKIVLVRPQTDGDAQVSDFVTGLRNPHDIVIKTLGATTYVYVSESHQINRYVYTQGATQAGARQIVVANLPDSSSGELRGAYGHQLKNIAIGADDKLYVSIASATNASPSDANSNPVRCAVYQYNADGTGGRLFAKGLRNAEGLAFVPGTNVLWVTVNNRDNIAYPFHQDFDGDGSDDYGKVMPAYVDNHPPDEFTSVKEGANYGWPFANPNPDGGMDNMPFDPDVQNNPEGSPYPVGEFTRIDKGIQAHSAPLGVSFLQGTNFPAAYRNGAVVALHGSWNRTRHTGYKIVYFPWSGNLPGAQMDFVSGWIDSGSQGVWGRPVDAVPDLQGNLLISDDASGTIYRVSPDAAAVTPSSTNWTGVDVSSGADNKTRVLWTSPDGRAAIRTFGLNGQLENTLFYGPYPNWTPRAVSAGPDGKTQVLWRNTNGQASLWRIAADGTLDFNTYYGPYAGWTPLDLAVGSDNKTRVLWTNSSGQIALWRIGANRTLEGLEINDDYGPFSGWTAKSLAVGADNKFRVMWHHTDGRTAFWTLNADRSWEVNTGFGPYPGWTSLGNASGSDGKTHVLWNHSGGDLARWVLNGSAIETNNSGPYPGWTVHGLGVGYDNKTRVFGTRADGSAVLWVVRADGSLEVNRVYEPF